MKPMTKIALHSLITEGWNYCEKIVPLFAGDALQPSYRPLQSHG